MYFPFVYIGIVLVYFFFMSAVLYFFITNCVRCWTIVIEANSSERIKVYYSICEYLKNVQTYPIGYEGIKIEDKVSRCANGLTSISDNKRKR